MRAVSLVLAALATGVPLFLLILGLSIHTYRVIRQSSMSVDLIPLPVTPPPEAPHPAQAKQAERAAAPAPPVPPPPAVMDRSAMLQPQPQPVSQPTAAVIGTGAGNLPGVGQGSGGDGAGGTGAGPANGAPVPPARTGASWIFKPGTNDLLPYNPPRARIESVTGQILLSCRVLASTRVADCRITSERPRGYGFGNAALAASQMFRLAPPTLDGAADEKRRVEIPVTFNNRR